MGGLWSRIRSRKEREPTSTLQSDSDPETDDEYQRKKSPEARRPPMSHSNIPPDREEYVSTSHQDDEPYFHSEEECVLYSHSVPEQVDDEPAPTPKQQSHSGIPARVTGYSTKPQRHRRGPPTSYRNVSISLLPPEPEEYVYTSHQDDDSSMSSIEECFEHMRSNLQEVTSPVSHSIQQSLTSGDREVVPQDTSSRNMLHEIAEKELVVTNEEKHITWDEYGLQLHFPINSLPEGLEQCNLNIKVGVSGEFQQPEDGVLVSAVYSFSHDLGQKDLQKPVTLQMQHCSTDIHHLSFTKCSNLNGKFSDIDTTNTYFTKSYGTIQLSTFSMYAIKVFLRTHFPTLFSPFDYCCKVFYTSTLYGQFRAEICIYRNLVVLEKIIEAQIARRDKKYTSGPPSEVKFQDSIIRPVVPTEKVNGWRLRGFNNTTVARRTVDQFTDCKVFCPSILRVTWEDEGDCKTLVCDIKLTGAEEGSNSISIESPNNSTTKDPAKPDGLRVSGYSAVQKSMEVIIRSLKTTPSAKDTLVTKFKQEGWIDTLAECSEEDIVTCALEKIRQNSTVFETFITMLRNTVGMSDVAQTIENLV